MQHITLCADDLARIRITYPIGQQVEAIFAVDALRNTKSEFFRTWRRRVNARILHAGQRLDGVRRLARVRGGSREILSDWLGGADTSDTNHSGILGVQQSQLLAAVEDMRQVAVQPYWNRIYEHLASTQDFRRDIMCGDGIEVLLNSLGPGIRWAAPVLEIDSESTAHLKPNGRGLLLSPSLFLQDSGAVLPSPPGIADGSPVLIFPDRPSDQCGLFPDEGLSSVPAAARRPQESLAGLVGRTRAAVLHALRDGCSNGDLAQKLGVSPAAVSQHTATLRNAGLISTRRSGSQVVHTVTTLGRHLLRDGSDSGELCGHVAPGPRTADFAPACGGLRPRTPDALRAPPPVIRRSA
ncbi:putative transcriptional regulator [Streptomyces lydicamycinicus]|uniref:Putative transcriptional regulator n=1 Tax=Streptomyces lydicamycinicus TaxID=1546107 RepID=A0A0P4R9A9_9ACTN|nr:metalloregulator ArsR/SmtB family transcription factor [Streptomyces lydicamycinicus]GAO09576.1 putative transcriptional regulator [Streptomyces lydicamycinicus]